MSIFAVDRLRRTRNRPLRDVQRMAATDPRHGRDWVTGWRSAEIVAWAVGGVCLAAWAGGMAVGELGRRAALASFENARPLYTVSHPDQHLWSPERIRAWTDTQTHAAPPPLGILRIPRLGLEVPILEGTDETTLNRAVGHIEDTSTPGSPGNSGIAGHRDGYFRVLKDARLGDVIDIETTRGVATYRIARMWIVAPEDVSVLDPGPLEEITLVTCYPFYFIGSAPQRFIVRAVRQPS